MSSDCPCYDCSDRHQDCHSTCTSYKAWKAEWDEQQKQVRSRKLVEGEIAEYIKSHRRVK